MTEFTIPQGYVEAEQARMIDRLRAQVAALTKDNDDIHELTEYYREENRKLRLYVNYLPLGILLLSVLSFGAGWLWGVYS